MHTHRMIIHSFTLVKNEHVFLGRFFCFVLGYFYTCQVYEDVAAIIREEAFGAWSAGRQPSSQNTQEVFYRYLKH